MDLEAKIIDHNVRLVAVPDEKLSGKAASDIKTVNGHEVLDFFEFKKSEKTTPNGLFLLATGERIDAEKVWGVYRKSERVLFFLIKT